MAMENWVLIPLITPWVITVVWLVIASQSDKRAARQREQELLTAILSKTAHEYALALEAMKRSPEHKLREMEIENELAEKAVALEGVPMGYPVT